MFNHYSSRSCVSFKSYIYYKSICSGYHKYHQYLTPENYHNGCCSFQEFLFLLIIFYGLDLFIFPLKFLTINMVLQEEVHLSNKIITVLWSGNTSILRMIHMKFLLGKNCHLERDNKLYNCDRYEKDKYRMIIYCFSLSECYGLVPSWKQKQALFLHGRTYFYRDFSDTKSVSRKKKKKETPHEFT